MYLHLLFYRPFFIVTLCVSLLLSGCEPSVSNEDLGFSSQNPVVFDNDNVVESGYLEIYVLALASQGLVDLRGVIRSSSFHEERRSPPYSKLSVEEILMETPEVHAMAKRNGFENLPPYFPGPSISLDSRKPESGLIDDTLPFGTPGAQFIVEQAKSASPEKPLVLVLGGQATIAADAYLLDPEIADNVIVAWQAGGDLDSKGFLVGNRYNYTRPDPWATYIVLERMRVVLFLDDVMRDRNLPEISLEQIAALPQSELRESMRTWGWPRGDVAWRADFDVDSPPALAVMRQDYAEETRRFSFSHWRDVRFERVKKVPVYKPDPSGQVLAVTRANGKVASEEWWLRVEAQLQNGSSLQTGNGDGPNGEHELPGNIAATDFDYGGLGSAYFDTSNNFTPGVGINPYRIIEHVDIRKRQGSDNLFVVTDMVQGEWLEYSVNVVKECALSIRSRGELGIVSVFEGQNRLGSVRIDGGKKSDNWLVTVADSLPILSEGQHVLKLQVEQAIDFEMDWLACT